MQRDVWKSATVDRGCNRGMEGNLQFILQHNRRREEKRREEKRREESNNEQ